MTKLFHRERGTGMPLVLLHAFPYDSRMWQPQLFGLGSAFRMIAPDLPGFGQSPLVEPITIDGMADAVIELLDSLQLNIPVTLVGLSMGGYVAMAIMRKAPARVERLILADTRADADDDAAKANRMKAIEMVKAEGPLAFVNAQIPKQLSTSTQANHPDVAKAARAIGESQKTEGIVAALGALRDRPDATPGLAKILIPTRIIVGSDDTITPPALALRMQTLVPGSTMVHIPGAGHLSNLENPDAFNEAIRTQ